MHATRYGAVNDNEWAVYRLAGQGFSNPQIASLTGIVDPSDILNRLFRRWGLVSRVEIIFAYTDEHYNDDELPASEFSAAWLAIKGLTRTDYTLLWHYYDQWRIFAATHQKNQRPLTTAQIGAALSISPTWLGQRLQAIADKLSVPAGPNRSFRLLWLFHMSRLYQIAQLASSV